MPEDNKELIRRLDTERMCKGWQSLSLKTPSQTNGHSYGVFPLGIANSEKDDLFELLIFGGTGKVGSLDRSMILSTPLSNFEASALHQLKYDSKDVLLGKKDWIVNNNFFRVSTWPFTSGAHKTLFAS